MQRISSGSTFFYKRLFPLLWVGFLAIFLAVGLGGVAKIGLSSFLPFIVVPLFMTAVGYLVFKNLIFDLVDEVWDAGDALIVRNKGQEDRIALSEIINVSYSPLVNPPRVTLSLRRPGVFGDKVSFCVPKRVWQWSSNPLVDKLIRRIDAARLRAR